MREFKFLKESSVVALCDILNNPTEDGYILQTKVPRNLPVLTWHNNLDVKIDGLSELERRILSQLKGLMEFSVKENHPIDLLPANFGLTEDGENLMLFDFLEDFDDEERNIGLSLGQAVRLWSGGNQNIKEYLINDLLKTNRELHIYFR